MRTLRTPIELSVQLAGDCVKITVTDYGPGIPPEKQPQLFERFQRLVQGDRPMGDGLGLGLYLARSLARAQGGTLIVQSPVHASGEAPRAAFTLALPVAGEVPEDV